MSLDVNSGGHRLGQIKKCDILNVFARHIAVTLVKILLFGDHKQLSPTVIAREASEFAQSAAVSLGLVDIHLLLSIFVDVLPTPLDSPSEHRRA